MSVTVNGDTAVEPNDGFTVLLSAPSGATIADDRAVGRILNDDSATLSIGDATVVEGDSAAASAVFTVTRSGAAGGPASVRWSTADGTAGAGSDYVAVASTTLDFAAGQMARTVSVTVNGDTAVEANETFVVRLSAAVGATIVDGSGLGRITNDDDATLAVDDVTVTETNSASTTATFTVTRSGATGGTSSVVWSTANGTAIAPGDYLAAPPPSSPRAWPDLGDGGDHRDLRHRRGGE